ncbi:MAG: YdcF family protein [Burkholderiaceae bacterium]|nr:YdcF family protein [Burkholderiaceae bacterium]
MLPFGAKSLLSAWLLPPVSLFLLALLGLLLMRRRPRLGGFLAIVALLAGIALSTPLAARSLMRWVEQPYAQLDPAPQRLPRERLAALAKSPAEAPQAIVVLTGGAVADGVASNQPNRVSSLTLERALHAHRVARLTGLPLLLTGGVTAQGGEPEARLMRAVLEGDFGTPVKWLETRSRDTAENAAFTRDVLQPAGIRRVLLVTHGYHMRRAQEAFERVGFTVTPAPHSFMAGPARFRWRDLIPSRGALAAAQLASHEILGLAWYRLLRWA